MQIGLLCKLSEKISEESIKDSRVYGINYIAFLQGLQY